jgi:hypothetical protein
MIKDASDQCHAEFRSMAASASRLVHLSARPVSQCSVGSFTKAPAPSTPREIVEKPNAKSWTYAVGLLGTSYYTGSKRK